jgi:hypothetical protein
MQPEQALIILGRKKSKTESIQAYGDTKSAKEEYTYENNLLKL